MKEGTESMPLERYLNRPKPEENTEDENGNLPEDNGRPNLSGRPLNWKAFFQRKARQLLINLIRLILVVLFLMFAHYILSTS